MGSVSSKVLEPILGSINTKENLSIITKYGTILWPGLARPALTDAQQLQFRQSTTLSVKSSTSSNDGLLGIDRCVTSTCLERVSLFSPVEPTDDA